MVKTDDGVQIWAGAAARSPLQRKTVISHELLSFNTSVGTEVLGARV